MRPLVLAALVLAWAVPAAPAAPEGDELDPLAGIRAEEFLAHVKWTRRHPVRGGPVRGVGAPARR